MSEDLCLSIINGKYPRDFKQIIGRSKWSKNWDFVRDFDFTTNFHTLKRAAYFLSMLPLPEDKTQFARAVLDTQQFEQNKAPLPFLQSYNCTSKSRRQHQLNETLNTNTCMFYNIGITPAFLPFMSEYEKMQAWVYNHTVLHNYALRLEYCYGCTTLSSCAKHLRPMKLVPVDFGWCILTAVVRSNAHLIIFDGFSHVQSILFLHSQYKKHLLQNNVFGVSPAHRVYVCLLEIICKQQYILKKTLKNAPYQTVESLNKRHSSLKYENTHIMKLRIINWLDQCHRHLERLCLELMFKKHGYVSPSEKQYLHSQTLRKLQHLAIVKEKVFVFNWNAQTGFLECSFFFHSTTR
jgi:hypothetical protein